VPSAVLEKSIKDADVAKAKAQDANTLDPVVESNLAGFIRTQYEQFRNHRDDYLAGWSERLLSALRTFNGEYDAQKIAEIRKFGGSEVYARIIAMKCRGASALLRDVYLAADRSWGIRPPADPDIPPEIAAKIQELVQIELQTLAEAGQAPDASIIRDRVNQLMEGARVAEKKQAAKRASISEDRIEEILSDGGFYKALAEFIVDLPLFPFACLKGPVVRVMPTVKWVEGRPVTESLPRMVWQRVSPFDLYWTPGVSDIEDAAVIERTRLTRADLNELLDLPGYNVEGIRAVLDEYGRGGLADEWDSTDTERAVEERRENPQFNRSGLISCLEYQGNVQGRTLLEYGMDKTLIPDEMRDYMVQAWLIDRHIIKVQLAPSPRKRHPYFITSFEKVPGTPVGNGLPDILSDIGDVANATLRALVNNLSISSGPQVVINDDLLAPGEDGEDLYPWKRWHVTTDPMGNQSQVPISFFQPNTNAAALLQVYKDFNSMADDISAIPKYATGGNSGGAGRTAAGLAMLMGNASKILQSVAANIDRDIFLPLLSELFDMLMLTDDTGVLRGDESIRVMGVNVAVQRETQRSRQLEFLQITANPMDAEIVGPRGRASVLRSVAQTIGLDGETIVPTEEQLQELERQAQMGELGGQAEGGQSGESSTNDMGPRENKVAGGAG
jgi:hypothetical protein